MRTTMLLVEFLVAGILVLLALIFLGISMFPSKEQAILNLFDQDFCLSAGALLATIFVAVAYPVGVFSEYLTRDLFEKFLDKTRMKRMRTYLKENRKNLKKSPILGKYSEIPPGIIDEKITMDEARKCIGPMRFHVLMTNSDLYRDIESQLHRLRLMRTLFLAIALCFLAIISRLIVTWYQHREISLFLLVTLVFFGLTAYETFKAIKDRADRYCRAVERSYRALVLDP